MKARLAAVQYALFLLLLGSLGLCAVALPRLSDRPLLGALTELEQVRVGFVPAQAEAELRAQAQSMYALPLVSVQQALGGQRAPKIKLTSEAPPVRPLVAVKLGTLAELKAQAEATATMSIGMLSPDALAAALALHVARAQPTRAVTLTSVELVPAKVTEQDAEREQKAAALRLQTLDSKRELERLATKLERAEMRVELRKKRRARSLNEYMEILAGVRAAHEQATLEHDALLQAYEREALAAEGLRVAVSEGADAHGVPTVAVARAELLFGNERRVFDIPVKLELRRAPVPPLRLHGLSTELPALHATGLWSQTKGLDATAAIGALRGRLSWHFTELELAGLSFTGADAVQWLPCSLLGLLMLLVRRLRIASTGYSPFASDEPVTLPRVGFRHRSLELFSVVLVPLFALACAGGSLLWMGTWPLVPALCAVVCVPLASRAYVMLQDLHELSVSIAQYHSVPPPLAAPMLEQTG